MGKYDKPEKKDKDEKPYLQFKLCKKECLACNECGYFWGLGASEELQGKHASWTREVEKQLYTADSVRQSLALKWDEYYAKLSVGQSPTWKCDQHTKELFCLSQWLINELMVSKCPSMDRRDVQDFFNRKARAENDLYELAARAMNSVLEGKIERYRRRR